MTMKHPYMILIADRNPHVRGFLKREMEAEGYRVEVAGNSYEIMKRVFGHISLHLLIMDPDLPDADERDIMTILDERIPALPIIIHRFSADYNGRPALPGKVVFVEKGGRSIEKLKNVAAEILKKVNLRHPGIHWENKAP